MAVVHLQYEGSRGAFEQNNYVKHRWNLALSIMGRAETSNESAHQERLIGNFGPCRKIVNKKWSREKVSEVSINRSCSQIRISSGILRVA